MTRNEFYDVTDDADEVELVKEECPRCGDVYLAEHGDRKHCGKCGYTEFE
ncbi:MAG: 30S ribosomal protein S27ae [Halobacteria archaeon]|nr:30S ribosomal protein S27ae [Halobacteria archaeon]